MLKDCRYGLWMGACFAPLILLLHVFPSNRSDDEFGGLILSVYLATLLYYGAAGFFSVRKSGHVRDGMRIGAITAVIGLGLIIATFALLETFFWRQCPSRWTRFVGFSCTIASFHRCARTSTGAIWEARSLYCPCSA